VRRLYLEKPFDIFVLPSDTFFYVRSLAGVTHELGIPVVVVQKETTISVATMDTHSVEVASDAAFTADLMTVCSERHRQFWLRAGADPARIVVTGQPRFDVYARAPRATPSAPPTVLFLSYVLDAYVPGVGQGMGLRTWEPLRTATERELIEAANAGTCRVVVKCHPHQDLRAESSRLRAMAGTLWGNRFSVAAANADTRMLILDADLVVGFQTTALYEASAAGKPVVYTAWGDEYALHREALIPFHQAPSDCVHVASSPEQLAHLLTTTLLKPSDECRAWYEEALGPIDGQATHRVVDLLGCTLRASAPTPERHRLDRRRRPFAGMLLLRATASEVVWAAATPVASLAGQAHRVAERKRAAAERRRLAIRGLRKG
jgi:hypothetical protein